MLKAQRPLPQGCMNSGGFAPVRSGPGGVVVE